MMNQPMTEKTNTIHLSEKELPKKEFLEKLEQTFIKIPYKGAETFSNQPVLINETYFVSALAHPKELRMENVV